MLTYVPSARAVERFKSECRNEEANLLTGKCQLCIDALLFMTPIPVSSESLTSSMRMVDEISSNIRTPLLIDGDEYLLGLIPKCPSVKIIYPSSIPFNGFVDLSLLSACTSLELVRIPFSRLTGVETLRNNLRSLVWIRGYNDEDVPEQTDTSPFTPFSIGNYNARPSKLKVDEIFWDQFGVWPLLNYLCISQSNITNINASTMPPSIKTLDLNMNRIYQFSNLANYSLISTITKLCLDYNSLKELPKLNDNTCATLVHLSLRGNLIDSIVGLKNFGSLDYLDISENAICDLRPLLNELMHLSKTLKTLYIEKNPVTSSKAFASKCQSVLYKLVKFNGRLVSRPSRIQRNDPETIPLPINVDATLQPSTSGVNRYGTFMGDSPDSNRSDIEDSLQRKAKVSRERFVVINEQGEEEGSYLTSQVSIAATSRVTTIEINNTATSKELPLSMKNYLFGGVSGSYGSFQQLHGQPEANIEMGSSVKSQQELTEEMIEAEKNKLLQKRIELGDDWLISSKERSSSDSAPVIFNGNTEIKPDKREINRVEITAETENDDIHTVDTMRPAATNLDETSEWDEEDTEDENTVFLVEIYASEAEFSQSLNAPSEDYFFIRVRPRDGLLLEKDCTSGKILTTMDLKILEQYQCLPQGAPEAEWQALRLLFDTTIISKRERVYKFMEENQCASFVQLYLTNNNYGLSKNKLNVESASASTSVAKSNLQNSLLSRNGSYTWFYMCLRCGHRTHRIITDCSKCGSDLIIKDEGGSAGGGNDFLKSITPLSSTPTTASNGFLEASAEHDVTSATGGDGSEETNTTKDNASILSEENIDSEPSQIDENYFRANIDHYLKLQVEIYIYEEIEEDQLKTESIESMCHCMAYNFSSKTFTAILVVFTQNYLFVFDHRQANINSKQANDEKESEVLLRFYRPLAGPKSSQFIISHLPGPLKNQAYWFECGFSAQTNKKVDRRKKRRKSKANVLELLLFDDKYIGKAFLQLFIHSHRTCLRSQQVADKRNESSLVLIKADLTELTNVDEEDFSANMLPGDMSNEQETLRKRKVKLSFDDACQKLLQMDDSPYSDQTLFAPESLNLFLVRSFNLIPASNTTSNGKAKNSLFKVEQNLVLLVTEANLILCKINGNFPTITPAISRTKANESLAKVLQPSMDTFVDQIEFRLLIKDQVVNLLPNIYIDKGQLLLVLRFRDEEHETASSNRQSTQSDVAKPRSGLIVYDFQIQFNNLNTLKRATRLIQSLWERNFGISLTISRLRH